MLGSDGLVENLSKRVQTVDSATLLKQLQQIVNIRSYKSDEVPNKDLRDLLEAFRLAPSMANHQPWEMLILDSNQKESVVEATLDPLFTKGSNHGQPWVANVPVAFVVMIDLRRSEARIGEEGVNLSMQDTFSAIQNFRVMAIIKGLATSVVREIDVKQLKKVLSIPNSFLPVAIVTVGYPNIEVELPPLLSVDEITHEGKVE